MLTKRLMAHGFAEMVVVGTAGEALHITDGGGEQVVDDGDAIFLRGSERSVIESGGRTTFTNISVPIDELTPMLASGEDLSMVPKYGTWHVRSEERRVGKECVSTRRARWSPYH